MIALSEWRVLEDEAALARAAADLMIAQIEDAGPSPAICLTGGSSPRALYARLAEPQASARIPFDRVRWFMGDERVAPLASPDSNMGQAMRLLLAGRAPPERIHAVRTDVAPDEAARLYDQELRALAATRGGRPMFSLVLLGLGGDGHVASLFPGQPALAERDARAVAVPEPGLKPFIPRVTLTLPALADCERMLFLVNGGDKADAVARVARGEDLPAARAQSLARASWLLDEAAAAALPRDAEPRLVLVMGVSGAGKTSVGRALAARCGFSFLDADDLHSADNRANMRRGVGLSDAAREPWLRAVAAEATRAQARGRSIVVACSALKRAYRDRLRAAHGRATLVLLQGPPDLIARRLANRTGHFMSPALLPDQFQTLERPDADEGVLTLDAGMAIEDLVARIRDSMDARPPS